MPEEARGKHLIGAPEKRGEQWCVVLAAAGARAAKQWPSLILDSGRKALNHLGEWNRDCGRNKACRHSCSEQGWQREEEHGHMGLHVSVPSNLKRSPALVEWDFFFSLSMLYEADSCNAVCYLCGEGDGEAVILRQ